ncbi:ParB/RepB/Spo0J family partition protein [Ligilactobacillus sp. LYQ60]|uniref:ParB/RepB/Spo0J family partition protein n=1 Tax=unclassified Ligilactobacillus TaxID=2767920 RepID=UPI003851EEC6
MSKENRGLGKGIEALFQDFDEQVTSGASGEHVVELRVADIRPNPYQPRVTFDDQRLQELADSIAKQGVFQPIIVRQSRVKGYELIAGERRFRASKLAHKETIPAIVRDFDEERMMEVAVLENLQREDLTPLEEAQAYATLIDKLHLTQTEVSARLGKSRPYIANYLRLLGLPTAVKKMLQANQLSMGQARTLLGLKDASQQVRLAKRTVKEGLTVRQLERLVNQINGVYSVKRKAPVHRDPYLHQGEQQLGERLGTKVAIKQTARTGKGKIEIEYLSPDDLNRILAVLNVNID